MAGVGLPPEHEALAEAALQFARQIIGPVAETIDREDTFPVAVWKQLAEQGYTGLGIPEEYGGSGGDVLAAALVGWALTRASPAVALSYGAHLNLCAHNLYRNGNEDQRRRYLPRLARGEWIGALGLTEPNAGSDATGIRATARREGDVYVLNGTKMFITNGPVADVVLVYAKTRPDLGQRGISAFIVERTFPGFRVAQTLDKLGMRGSPTGELVFEDCRVPAENLLGQENEGLRIMMSGLDMERAFFAWAGVGIAEEAFELALRYATQREQFGRRIGEFQLIQAKLSDMYTGIQAARLLALHALQLVQEGRRASKEAAAALLFASQVARRATDEAVQIHGGYGYVRGSVVERLFRDAKLMDIGAGTNEIRRTLLARELLGLR
ncbi:isovaleryl-CoA dehydrogenase [Caldinitratiruptor microaerophilus]|uniref:Isovaleryl-CoA dehydrogenase n=1 Tax=Caldinitratiruptor microaerophilus TaxID=671077 RepID=A0AA35CIK1_9FIRM|nr:isovaleryl-CoA dehydrogenase [Caldinitratiruptor microaerophilus]